MYAPSELLEKVKKQVLTEFKDQIISFDWYHEQECTFIVVQIGEIALQIPAINRIHEIVYSIMGHPDSSEYIVPVSVRAKESVEATDGLFNLTYDGAGSNSFFLHYYAPDRDRLIPFNVPIYYKKMFEAIRTIHLDSPTQLWKQLVRPSHLVQFTHMPTPGKACMDVVPPFYSLFAVLPAKINITSVMKGM